jgi:integrase
MEGWVFGEALGAGSEARRRWEGTAEAWAGGARSSKRQGERRRILNLFFAWQGKAPEQVRTEDAQAWADWLRRERYLTTTISSYMRTVSSFYSFAAREAAELEGRNPARDCLPGLRGERQGAPRLDREELERLLGCINRQTLIGQRDYALVRFLIDSVWPPEAALRLRWGDFEVTQAGAACFRPHPRGGAAGEGERVETRLDWETWGAMASYLKAAGRLEQMEAGDYIFTPLFDLTGFMERSFGGGWERRPLSIHELCRELVRLGRRAGLARVKITPGNLRRSAAVLRWEEGASAADIQGLLDHRWRSTTMAMLRRAGKGEG